MRPRSEAQHRTEDVSLRSRRFTSWNMSFSLWGGTEVNPSVKFNTKTSMMIEAVPRTCFVKGALVVPTKLWITWFYVVPSRAPQFFATIGIGQKSNSLSIPTVISSNLARRRRRSRRRRDQLTVQMSSHLMFSTHETQNPVA